MSIEKMLRNAKVIDDQEGNIDTVGVGSRVTLTDMSNGSEVEYMIVGSAEADPLQSRISNESPVGRSLIGQKVGNIININVPMGAIQYKIVCIKK